MIFKLILEKKLAKLRKYRNDFRILVDKEYKIVKESGSLAIESRHLEMLEYMLWSI